MKKPRRRFYTFRGRFYLTWGAGLVALTIVIVAALLSIEIMLRAYQRAARDIIADENATQQIEMAALHAARLASGYTAYGVTQDFEAAVERTESALALARSELNSREELRLLNVATDEWELFVRLSREVTAIPNRTDAAAILAAHRRDAQVDSMVLAFDALHDYLEQESNERVALSHTQGIRLLVTLAIVFIIIYAISLHIGLRFIRSVVRPLRELDEAAKHFESGDLSWRLTVQTDDEFGQLANTFNGMADRLAATMQRLESLSRRDGLTGLYNRREFDERLAAELIRARRYNHAGSLLLLDVDRFKLINDRYGHQAGDAALKHLAGILQGRLREADVAFRFGGDEFAILLPETGQQDAVALAEGLRTLVAARTLQFQGQTLSLSISVGVGSYPECGLAPESLVAVADASLYADKAARRDGTLV